MGTKAKRLLIGAVSAMLAVVATILGYQQLRPAGNQIESIAVMPFVNARDTAQSE